MTIHVLHAYPYKPVVPGDEYWGASLKGFKSVALVDPPEELTSLPARLEYAFAATQNIDEAWSPEGYRSTSVGDRMWIDNELWQVCGRGFGRVFPEETQQELRELFG
jgi:hypothetical protein